MKEWPMRRVKDILSIALLIAGIASPALAAAHRKTLISRSFFDTHNSCPSNCPIKSIPVWGMAAVIFGLSTSLLSSAYAADYDLPYVPVLRGSAQPPAPVYSVGPATFTRWSGFYFGGDASITSAYADFSTATRSLVHNTLQFTTVETQDRPSNFQVLGSGSAVTPGGGVFLGYNTQWQDLILGVEATYTHTNLNMTPSSASVARVFGDTGITAGVAGSGNLNLTDYGTARGRAGYVIGNFLPYAFVGMAVGRASYSVNANILYQDPLPSNPIFFSASAGQNNALLWGYTVGAGLDWALTPNIFVRGEFEFVQFAPINNIAVSMGSGHLGGGLKF
jgi:outer membrane immunogenic protein